MIVHPRLLRVLAAVISLGLAMAPAAAAARHKAAHHRSVASLPLAHATSYPGVEHLSYKFGPIHVLPGQNTIQIAPNSQRPNVPGYITAFYPNLHYTNGAIPGVDVLHLHHGVWLINGSPTFAVGEEKTRIFMPKGYGYPYKPSDSWLMNYMIHNIYPAPADVYITYDIDFIPATAPAAQTLKPVRTIWMDVEAIKAYPVFDALRRLGKNGLFTFPNDSPNPYPDRRPNQLPRNEYVVKQAGTLIATAGHLHPGGLHTDLFLTRNGKTVDLFTSHAHYFEPAGAVSWDVAMSATPPNWRVQVQPGDILGVTGTYDVSRASWYEVMAIMPIAFAAGDTSGVDPFTTPTNVPGVYTHGHLSENNNHGGALEKGAPDPFRMSNGFSLDSLNGSAATQQIGITDFLYQLGDFSQQGPQHLPPVIRQGQSLTFINNDSPRDIFHTITSCKDPCNRTYGIAFPLANGPYDFDSGELGYGPAGFTPAANRNTWSTPTNLPPGTYTYFCRIHPWMRGSFRVAR